MQNKVQPRILPGFMELLPEDQILFNRIYDTIRHGFECFGYLPLDTPVIELSDVLLAKAGGETEKQIYRFSKGDNDLSLRFDLTVPLARYVAQRYNDLVFPFKRYQMSKVFRGERPQKGRFREFYQCDIDIIGNDVLDLVYDAEMPAVIYSIFKELSFGDFTIRINNRKILNGFFEELGLTETSSDILRVIDKIEKIGQDVVYEEFLSMHIEKLKIQKIIDFISLKGNYTEIISSLRDFSKNDMFNQGIFELESVCSYMVEYGIPEDNFKIDLTIARGLDYYTGTVYETILNNYPKLGSICSGGRYENLTGYYTDKKMPGIGISIGLSRLFYQLRTVGVIQPTVKSLTDVLIVPMDKSNMSYALNVAARLRKAGIITDIYCADKGMKQKMKYADKLGIAFVAVIGEDEIQHKTVSLKNMESGTQNAVEVENLINFIMNNRGVI